jgi:drug/metabolite transporter (DMT)-like permease
MVSHLVLAYVGALLTAAAHGMLKQGAQATRDRGALHTFFHPFSLTAFAVFLAVTVLNLKAFRVLPFRFNALVLPANYLFVGGLSRLCFSERLTRAQGAGAILILAGTAIYFL